MGDVSIKMYDKFGGVLRIESTSNDISTFRVKRKVIVPFELPLPEPQAVNAHAASAAANKADTILFFIIYSSSNFNLLH